MHKYIALVSFTEEGIKSVKDTAKRATDFTKKVRKKGINIDQTYWTVGRYDLVHIFEAPSEEVAAAMSLALGSMGNVRTETLRAFDLDEMSQILSAVYDLQVAKGTLQ